MWVADVVAGQALRLADEEDGAAASASVLERVERGQVEGLDVFPIHVQRAHPEGSGALGQVLDRPVLRLRRRLRPAVVLADEDDRHLPELSQVQRLVKGPRVGRPVAEEGDGDARLAAQLEGECGANRRSQTAADDGVRAHVAALDVVEVHRAAVARGVH